jgi:hypothetical protein
MARIRVVGDNGREKWINGELYGKYFALFKHGKRWNLTHAISGVQFGLMPKKGEAKNIAKTIENEVGDGLDVATADAVREVMLPYRPWLTDMFSGEKFRPIERVGAERPSEGGSE